MLISVSARNFLKSRKGGVNFNFNFDLYRAMGCGFNCNLDITRSFHQILITFL